jgi:hypothetical protein
MMGSEMVTTTDTTLIATGSEDSYVDNDNPTTNYGSGDTLNVASNALGSSYEYYLLRFDLSEILADAVVDEAVLTLYCANDQAGTTPPIRLYRITGSWTESGAATSPPRPVYWAWASRQPYCRL